VTPACCSGVCKDLASDINNCGGCGNVCGTNETCQGGACVSVACQPSVCGHLSLCQGRTDCACFQTPEGAVFCASLNAVGSSCSGSSDCPAGWMCALGTCLGGGVCLAPCA
jgi:hypothetical protein